MTRAWREVTTGEQSRAYAPKSNTRQHIPGMRLCFLVSDLAVWSSARASTWLVGVGPDRGVEGQGLRERRCE
eukprot:256202-Rhodomonas_salina.1